MDTLDFLEADPLLLDPRDTLEPETRSTDTLEPENPFLNTLKPPLLVPLLPW